MEEEKPEEVLEEKDNMEQEVETKNENIIEEVVSNREANNDLNDMTDKYKRLLAEFENYKKRNSKERVHLYDNLVADVVSTLLPILDNMEKAVEAQTKDEEYKAGIELLQRQLLDILEGYKVEKILTKGETFDPELHEAVQHIEDSKYKQNEIVEEYRAGYRIGSKIIRHSMVVVAN